MDKSWLNVVEHVMIEYRGMMSWLFPALVLKKYNTMQYEVMGHHPSLGHRVQRMVFTGVTRVSHLMPALNLALNADFEKKH